MISTDYVFSLIRKRRFKQIYLHVFDILLALHVCWYFDITLPCAFSY